MEVKPFKAFRFDKTVVGDVGGCIAPPYDVISPAQQQQLYEKSQYNIVRIIKGKTTPSDNDTNNQYTRAADYLNTWIKKGVLKQDSVESIYACVQDFELSGTQFQRYSFIASAKLEDFGKTVRPHEQTLDEPKIDRLNLKRATAAKLGLALMLYEDEHKIADRIIENSTRQKPLINFADEEGFTLQKDLKMRTQQNVRHRLFAITAKNDIEKIAKMMLDKSCIIGDGHHRYETDLNYYKETANPAAGYQMMAFSNICHDGLVVLATHRLVGNLEDFRVEKLLASLKENFIITEFKFDSAQVRAQAKQQMLTQMKTESNRGENAFGIYGGNNAFYAAVLKNKQAMDSVAPEKSDPWKSLDVSVLHKLIFEELLDIDEQKLASQSNIEYIKDTGSAIDESIAKVDDRQKQAAFFMNPVKIEQLKTITASGEKMPQKSTYFYPKIYTGLTISKL